MINPFNNTPFCTSDELFARIRKNLSSFDAAGQVDEGDFYNYVREVLEVIGIAYYQEQEAEITIKDHKGYLPPNFYQLYAAYKFRGVDRLGYLLELSAHVPPKYYADECMNRFHRCPHHMSIEGNMIYTNFTGDRVFLQYYGLPVDERTGLPLIPREQEIEKAIEYYIMFRTLELIWLNNQAPDIEKRVMYLNGQQGLFIDKARYKAKLPAFGELVAYTRQRRGRFDIYNRLTDSKATWYQ